MPKPRDFLVTLFLNAMALAIVLPALPSTVYGFSRNLSDSSTRYTFLVIAFLLIYILGSIHVGTLLDRVGRRLFLLLTLAVNTIGLFLLVLPLNYLQILLARALNGYGQISSTVIQASLSDLTAVEHRPQIFGLMNSILALAFIAGSSISGFIAMLSNGTSLLYIFSFLLSLCSLFVSVWRCPETHRSAVVVPSLSFRDLFILLRGPRFRLFLLLLCFNICNLGLLVIWPFYVKFRFDWGAFESGLSLSVLAISFAISQALVLPYCLIRFSPTKLLRYSIVSTIVILILLGFADQGVLFTFLPFLNVIGFTGVSLVQGALSKSFTASQQGALSTLFALLSSVGTLISLGLSALVMAWLGSIPITSGAFAGSPFYILALVFSVCCLWRPHRLLVSLDSVRDDL